MAVHAVTSAPGTEVASPVGATSVATSAAASAASGAVSSNRPDRASVLAAMEAIDKKAAGEPAAAAADEKPETKADAKPDAKKPADDVDDDDDDDAKPEVKADAKPDAETAKRLAVVAKAEKRGRDALNERKVEIDRREADLARRENEITKQTHSFESLQKSARRDPLGVLAKLGFSDEDFEPLAKVIYSASKAGKANPKTRADAEQAMQARELNERLDKTERELADHKAELKQRDEQATNHRQAQAYLANVVKAATPEVAPRVADLLAKKPAKAGRELGRVTLELLEQTGEPPDHIDVVKAYEAELEDLGVTAPAAKAAAEKAPDKPAEKKAAKTLEVGGGSGARPPERKAMTADERRAELVKGMPWRDAQ